MQPTAKPRDPTKGSNMADETADAAVANPDEEKLTDLKARKTAATRESTKHEKALASLTSSGIGKATDAFKIIDGLREESDTLVSTIAGQIDTLERRVKTAKYVEPLIKAIGTIEVEDSAGLPSTISLEDVGEKLAKAKTAARNADSAITVFTAIQAAVKAANIPDGAIGDIRPIHLKPDGEKKVTAEIASGRGGGGGGGGAGRGGLRKISAVGDDVADSFIGMTFGKGGDFKSARECVKAMVSDEQWTALDGTTATGRDKSWSAVQYMQRTLGVKFEDMPEQAEEAAS